MATDPPGAKGAKETEFNEGLLFFGLHKNHALVLQSSALRVMAYNDYLNWLLQDATDELVKENRVELLTTLPGKLRRAASPLKSIVLTPTMHAEPVVPHPRGVSAIESLSRLRMDMVSHEQERSVVCRTTSVFWGAERKLDSSMGQRDIGKRDHDGNWLVWFAE